MTTDGSWFNRPPRRFPAQVWLERRYGFRIPPLRLAQPPADAPQRRAFPAKVWLAQRQAFSLRD